MRVFQTWGTPCAKTLRKDCDHFEKRKKARVARASGVPKGETREIGRKKWIAFRISS